MKKYLKSFLFIFCLMLVVPTALVGFSTFNFVSAEEVDSKIYIKYATTEGMEASEFAGFWGLKEYVEAYSSSHAVDEIVLSSNIDMSGIVLTKTIGDATNPFKGTFDGKGYSVSNLTFDMFETVSDASEKTNQYAGLFGVVSGATIQNVDIGGTMKIRMGGCLTAYVGALVGKAGNNSTIKNSQISANILLGTNFVNISGETDFANYNTIKNDFDFNLNFGFLAGAIQDSAVSYVVARGNGLGSLNFSRNDGRTHAIGGLVGRLNNGKISFVVILESFDVEIEESFVGNVYLGGVAGEVSSGNSEILNVAVENSYVLTDASSALTCGEVVGVISNPVPSAGNIAYVHFKSNELNAFGDAGAYVSNSSVSESFYTLSNLVADGDSWDYFAGESWHPLYGDWDFKTVWYVNTQKIYLQSLYGKFSVSVTNLNADILTCVGGGEYDYGDIVELNFDFVGEMAEFYRANFLKLGSSSVATIVTKVDDQGKWKYTITGSDAYDVEATDNGFCIIVKNVNLSTAGNYSVSTVARTFSGRVSSKLFDDDGVEDVSVSPAYVYYADAPYTTTETLTWNDKVTYGQTYRIDTRAKAGYAFVGWFEAVEGGQDREIEVVGNSKLLTFTFGEDFSSDFEIYAKYTVDVCNITCVLGEGISKIIVKETEVKSFEQEVPVPKTDQELKLEVYVDKGYNFNVEEFIKTFDDFKSFGPNVNFCTLRETREEDENVVYHFVFDMTTLRDDYANAFTVNARATHESETKDNSWMWWVIGGVGGAFVIAMIVLLIVFLVRRGGGGYGGMKMKKGGFKKNMYY